MKENAGERYEFLAPQGGWALVQKGWVMEPVRCISGGAKFWECRWVATQAGGVPPENDVCFVFDDETLLENFRRIDQ